MSTRRSRVRSPGSAAPAGDEPKEGRKEYCRENPPETADYRWRWLYRAGGAAALFGVAIIPIQLLVFVAWGQPDTAIGWFALFENNPLHGLLAFELLFVVNATFGIATTLALYVALRRVSESLMAIALASASWMRWPSSLRDRPSRCSTSARSTRPPQRMRREICSWRRVRRSWPHFMAPLSTSATIYSVSTC